MLLRFKFYLLYIQLHSIFSKCLFPHLQDKPEYLQNGVWLMNDETAPELRTPKDSTGNYQLLLSANCLWRFILLLGSNTPAT